MKLLVKLFVLLLVVSANGTAGECERHFGATHSIYYRLCKASEVAHDILKNCDSLDTSEERSFCQGRRVALDPIADCSKVSKGDDWLKTACEGFKIDLTLNGRMRTFEDLKDCSEEILNQVQSNAAFSIWLGNLCFFDFYSTHFESESSSLSEMTDGQLISCFDDFKNALESNLELKNSFQTKGYLDHYDLNFIRLGVISSILYPVENEIPLRALDSEQQRRFAQSVQKWVDIQMEIDENSISLDTNSALAQRYGITYLIHSTRPQFLMEILMSGELKPSLATSNRNLGGMNNRVYLEAGIPSQLEDRSKSSPALFVFGNQLLDEYEDYYLSLRWPYGHYQVRNSSTHSKHRSRVAYSLNEIGKQGRSNEFTFPDQVSFKNLQTIYVSASVYQQLFEQNPEVLKRYQDLIKIVGGEQ
jgi:hypothetical protein